MSVFLNNRTQLGVQPPSRHKRPRWNDNPAMSADLPEVGDDFYIQTIAEPLHQKLKKQAELSREVPVVRNGLSPTKKFRPVRRQPTGLLMVFDEGSRDDGEVIRIRNSSFAIGRTEGNLTIGNDRDVSSKHVEIRCQAKNGSYRWFIVDRNSTNGTFVRVYRAVLSKKSELLFGSRRYLFSFTPPPQQDDGSWASATFDYHNQDPEEVNPDPPSLAVIRGRKIVPPMYPIEQDGTTIGRSQDCAIVANDPYLCPAHAKFYRDEQDRWVVEDNKSENGTWLRIKCIPVSQQVEFQIGQQRFLFKQCADMK